MSTFQARFSFARVAIKQILLVSRRRELIADLDYCIAETVKTGMSLKLFDKQSKQNSLYWMGEVEDFSLRGREIFSFQELRCLVGL